MFFYLGFCVLFFALRVVVLKGVKGKANRFQMKVTGAVQLATIASGIRLLTMINFNLNRLQRKYCQVRKGEI